MRARAPVFPILCAATLASALRRPAAQLRNPTRPDLQLMLRRSRTISDEECFPVSHVSEEGVDLQYESTGEEEVGGRQMRHMMAVGGERMAIVFSPILDDMCEDEEVREVGKDTRRVMKAMFQEDTDCQAMGALLKKWNDLFAKSKGRREGRIQRRESECGKPRAEEGQGPGRQGQNIEEADNVQVTSLWYQRGLFYDTSVCKGIAEVREYCLQRLMKELRRRGMQSLSVIDEICCYMHEEGPSDEARSMPR